MKCGHHVVVPTCHPGTQERWGADRSALQEQITGDAVSEKGDGGEKRLHTKILLNLHVTFWIPDTKNPLSRGYGI